MPILSLTFCRVQHEDLYGPVYLPALQHLLPLPHRKAPYFHTCLQQPSVSLLSAFILLFLLLTLLPTTSSFFLCTAPLLSAAYAPFSRAPRLLDAPALLRTGLRHAAACLTIPATPHRTTAATHTPAGTAGFAFLVVRCASASFSVRTPRGQTLAPYSASSSAHLPCAFTLCHRLLLDVILLSLVGCTLLRTLLRAGFRTHCCTRACGLKTAGACRAGDQPGQTSKPPAISLELLRLRSPCAILAAHSSRRLPRWLWCCARHNDIESARGLYQRAAAVRCDARLRFLRLRRRHRRGYSSACRVPALAKRCTRGVLACFRSVARAWM